jgi:adenosylcobinamide kinase/adenosylcobinamide-phosphate guanylyltransferase
VLGGVRSGKSGWAEDSLAAEASVTYLATGYPRDDADWADRVRAHQERRPAHWRSVESLDIAGELATTSSGALLVDDLGNWVARTIDASDGWSGDLTAYRQAATELAAAWAATSRRTVLVGNEVGGGIHPETRAGRIFQDEVGRLNAALAAQADEVVLVIAGLPQWLKRTTAGGTQ